MEGGVSVRHARPFNGVGIPRTHELGVGFARERRSRATQVLAVAAALAATVIVRTGRQDL
jgi:hypothetical protein